MSDDRFSADTDRLRASARRLDTLQGRVRALSSTIDQLRSRFPDAGGDGDFKKSYDTNYTPAADAAVDFMDQLGTSVDEVADGTAEVSRNFGQMEDAATRESRHQQ